MCRTVIPALLISFFILSFKPFLKETRSSGFVLEGVVIDEQKQPLQKVHLFTVLGEEETITNKEGRFSFKTGQSLPLKLTVQLQDYEEKAIELTTAPGRLTIELKRK